MLQLKYTYTSTPHYPGFHGELNDIAAIVLHPTILIQTLTNLDEHGLLKD